MQVATRYRIIITYEKSIFASLCPEPIAYGPCATVCATLAAQLIAGHTWLEHWHVPCHCTLLLCIHPRGHLLHGGGYRATSRPHALQHHLALGPPEEPGQAGKDIHGFEGWETRNVADEKPPTHTVPCNAQHKMMAAEPMHSKKEMPLTGQAPSCCLHLLPGPPLPPWLRLLHLLLNLPSCWLPSPPCPCLPCPCPSCPALPSLPSWP